MLALLNICSDKIYVFVQERFMTEYVGDGNNNILGT